MLPGFNGNLMLSGTAGFAPTFSSSSASTSIVVSYPGSAPPNAGRAVYILLAAATNSSGAPTDATPSGFTSVGTITVGNSRASLAYKIATGGETGSVVGGLSGNSAMRRILARFDTSTAVTGVTVLGPNGQATTGDPASQTVAVGSSAAPALVIGIAYSPGATPNVTGTLRTGGTLLASPSTDYVASYVIQNAPAGLTWDMADTGTNLSQSFGMGFA